MILQIYSANIKDQDIPIVLHNIKEQYKNFEIKKIYSIEDLTKLWEQSNNLQLFSFTNSQNFTTANTSTLAEQVLILINIDLTNEVLTSLQKLNKTKTVFLINCKIPKNVTTKISSIPTNLKQKPNITYAKTKLQKHLTNEEIEQVLPSLLLENSDYYINPAELNKLLKQLQLPCVSKCDIIKNYTQTKQNVFKLTEIFLNADINKATEYIQTFLKTNDIHTLLSILKNNLQIIYLLKKYPETDVAKDLKKNPFFVKQLRKAAHKYTEDQLYKLLTLIFEFELNIRKGKYENPNKHFLLFLLKIKSLLKH